MKNIHQLIFMLSLGVKKSLFFMKRNQGVTYKAREMNLSVAIGLELIKKETMK